MRRGSCVFLLALLASCGTSDRDRSLAATRLSPADVRAIRAVDSAYVAAWIRDDTTSVLVTLEPGAVFMPAGQHPLVGVAEVRAFWWPMDGSHTKILTFARHLDELDGRGDVAWIRGTDSLTFTYVRSGTPASTMSSRSMTFALLRRQATGEWRISRMMWGTRTR